MENRSHATWKGNLKNGDGEFAVGENEYLGVYSFESRFEKEEDTKGTNPEELLAAAHASCFSMALSLMIEQADGKPERVHTIARVNLEKEGEGFEIKKINLQTSIKASGLDNEKLKELANKAKEGCPVSKLFKGAKILLETEIE
jgi:osmotically inducible protein OsmC